MDEKQMEKTVNSINEGIEQLKKDISQKANVETLENKYSELETKLQEQLEKVTEKEYFQKQQEQLDKISTDLMDLSQSQQKGKSIGDIMESKMNSDEYKKAMSNPARKSGQLYDMQVKTMLTSDVNSGDIDDQVESGVAKHPWRENPIWNSLQKGVIGEGKDSLSWWEEVTRSDNAEMTGEEAKPGSESSKTWAKRNLDIGMVKDYTKVSRSMLEDWEYARSEALDLMNNGIPRKREEQILDGNGTGDNLTGIISQAKAFSKPANFEKVKNANEIDAIRAIMTQIMNGDTTDTNKKGYIPNILAVNPGTLMQMRSIKDQNGSYIIPPLGSGFTNIDGIQVVPSLDLDADEFLMGDFTKAKAYIKRNMRVSFHYENENDVIYDRVLILAVMRLAAVKIANQHKFAFVNGTFSNVISAIQDTTG